MAGIKYRPAIVETFIDHYCTGLYTLQELCKLVNISPATYHYWLKHEDEFAKRMEEAERVKIKHIHTLAVKGQVKLLTGMEYEEVSEEYEIPQKPVKYDFLEDDDPLNQVIKPEDPQPVLKKRHITKKTVLPNHNVVIFTLRNLDRENYPDTKQPVPIGGAAVPMVPVAFIPPAGMADFTFPSNTDDDTDTTGNPGTGDTGTPGNEDSTV